MLKKFILLEEKSNTQGIKKQKQKHEEKNFWDTKKCYKECINAVRKRTIIFNAFVDKFIYSEDVEKDVHYTPEELESESFEESIPELTKIRRQKKSWW